MDTLARDVRYAVRLFLRTPGFTLPAVAALVLGIAANTAIFSVVNRVLLKPLPYPAAGRMVMFLNTFATGRSGSAAPTEFNWWREQGDAFEDVAAYDFGVANLTATSLSEQIPVSHVTSSFFRLCGARALYGRTFTSGDDQPHGARSALLAHAFWQRRFGGDTRVVGTTIELNGERYAIAGVLDPAFQDGALAEQSLLSGDIEVHDAPAVYLPFPIDPASRSHSHYFNVAGRLRPGLTLAAASAGLQAGYAGFARRWPGVDMPGRGFAVAPLQGAIVGGVRNSLLLLAGAVGLVLLIACANTANLLLARAAARRREIVIRAAVGGSRARILRQLLTESLILSLTAGALGLWAGHAAIRAILAFLPGRIPRLAEAGANVAIDWRVFAFTTAVSVLSGIVFGMVPAFAAVRADLRIPPAPRHRRARTALLATEMALAVVLLVAAALLLRTFLGIRRIDPGFDPRHVLSLRMSLVGPRFASAGSVPQFIRQAVRRLRAIPGVEAATSGCCVPLEDRLHGSFRIVGRPPGPDSAGLTGWARVSDGYFETFRIRLLHGRTFTAEDDSGPPVAIVNRTLARRFWRERDPLGEQIAFMDSGPPRRIVGVVGDVLDESLTRAARPILYLPAAQTASPGAMTNFSWAFAVRTGAAPLALVDTIQSELRAAGGGLPVAQVRTMDQVLWRSSAAANLRTLLLAVFGGSALLLAAIGIYGVAAYTLSQRRHEIAIRIALGAGPGHVRGLVLAQAIRPALFGASCGVGAALGVARWISAFLFGVKPWDPTVFLAVPTILFAVVLLAVWRPVLHSNRIDPARALRHESLR